MPKEEKRSSHFKGGLLAGALFGLAAGIYMSSKQGKQMAKKLKTQAADIQKRIEKEVKGKSKVTEETYKEAIDTVLAYYIKSRKIAKTEIPELRRYLLSKWKDVQGELKEVHASKKSKKK